MIRTAPIAAPLVIRVSAALPLARSTDADFSSPSSWAGVCVGSSDDVILACGDPGERVAALARFKQADGPTAIFMRLRPWRARWIIRSYVRYYTHARATIRRKTGNLRASVVDISLGGLALELAQVPGAARLDVRVGTGTQPRILRAASSVSVLLARR